MYKLNKSAAESTVEVMAAQSDGGGFYGRSIFDGAWYTGSEAQLKKAGVAEIKKATVRVERTYL